MSLPAWVPTMTGSLMSFGFGVADLWQFHAFAKEVDLLFLMGGLGALGIHTAYQWGKVTPS